MTTPIHYRYPGSRPFSDTDIDRGLFFGRDLEKSSFLYKVLADDLVILYSKSGLGKTSLINVGINQGLRDKGFSPIMVNFNDPKDDPLKRFYQEIDDYARKEKIDYISGERDSLWQYFKTAEFWSANVTLLKPVLVLDQFEEFFTSYSPGSRIRFIRQLTDLVNDTMPEELRKSRKTGSHFTYRDRPSNVKIIISIREDYLGQLDEMSLYIPDILHNRFRLSALTRDQAREAITKPVQIKNDAFSVPPFYYSPETVDMMLDFLCKQREKDGIKVKNEVESFQLQLLCSDIEEKVREKTRNGQKNVIVNKGDLRGEAGMQGVLERFYDNQLKRISSAHDRKRIYKLFEQGLISQSNRRLPMAEDEIERKFKVPKERLTDLVNCHLLRSEPRLGNIFYELSHDTMISPIQESQKKRKSHRRKVYLVVIAVFILIIMGMVIGFGGGIIPNPGVKKNQLLAEAGKLKIEGKLDEAAEKYSNIIRMDKTSLVAYLELGDLYYAKGEFDKAITIYNKSIKNGLENATIYFRLGRTFSAKYKPGDAIESSRNAATEGEKSLKIGAGNYKNKKFYHEAIKNYRIALESDKKNPDIFLGLALLYVKGNEAANAIDVYKEALKADAEFAYIYKEIAEGLKGQKGNKYVEEIYDLASKSGCRKASHYFNLGNDYTNLTRFDDAIENYREAIRLEAGYSDAYSKMGDVYYLLESYSDAIDNYNTAIEIDQKNADAYNGLGSVFSATKQFNKAIDAFTKAVQIDPGYGIAYYNMGNAFYYLGDYGKAIKKYEKAIENMPDHFDSYYNIGIAHFKQGEYKKATGAYKQALRINPNDSDTKTNIAFGYLLLEDFTRASAMANNLLKNKDILVRNKCTAMFVSISSLLFREKKLDAVAQLKQFMQFFKTYPHSYADDWHYTVARDFIRKSRRISPPEFRVLLALLDAIGAPPARRANKLKNLETAAREISR